MLPIKYHLEDLSKYKNLRGIQGVSLGILPEYRNQGIGKQLRDLPKTMGYDYIWGQHFKSLKNVEHWTKFGRRKVADDNGIYVTLMDLKKNVTENFKHHSYQTDAYDCGPACIKMVADFLGKKYKNYNELIKLCAAAPNVGTVDTGIKTALDCLGVSNMRNPYLGNEQKSINLLDTTLKNNNLFIMRTLTRGIKHWIVVYKKINGLYKIADPWLGKISYTLDEILSIWTPRNFDGFAIKK